MRHRWETSRFAAVAGIVLVAVAACGGNGGGDAGFDPAAVVAAAADRLEQQDAFHFILDHDGGGTRIVQSLVMTHAEGDIARPARMQADLKAETAGQTLEARMIGIDQQVWLTNPFAPDTWQLLPGVAARDVLDLEQVPGVLRQLADPRADGREKVGGVECYRVRGTVDSGAMALIVPEAAEAGLQVQVTIWAGVDDSLPRRIVVDGPLNPDEPEKIARTLTLSNFGVPVTIEPPA